MRHMGKNNFYTVVDTTLASLDKKGVRKLLKIAGESTYNYDIVAGAAIHYTNLGNPDSYEWLSKLILGLEELEDRKPHLAANESIIRRLIGPLGGYRVKKRNGVKLDRGEVQQHELRAFIAEELLLEIIKKRPLKVASFLLWAMRDPALWTVAAELFETTMEHKPWKINYNGIKELTRGIVPALSNWESREAAVRVIRKVIDGGQIPMIYLVGPLLAASEEPSYQEECKKLLDKLLQKELGAGTGKAMVELVGVLSANFHDSERPEYATRIAEKIIDENQVPLIYFVGPFLGATQNVESRRYALPLLNKIKRHLENGRKLGRAWEDVHLRTQRIVNAASSNPIQRFLAKVIREQMKKEKLWNTKKRERENGELCKPRTYEGPTWKRPLGEIARIKGGRRKLPSK